jgi:predicted RNA polymerase sigma factor
VIQAAIASLQADDEIDWPQVAALYGELARITGSSVVELNRAVAVSMAYGPQAGLDLADQLAAEPALRGYHLLASVRGDLLLKLGRADEARAEFERAAALTRNDQERQLSAARARSAAGGTQPGP